MSNQISISNSTGSINKWWKKEKFYGTDEKTVEWKINTWNTSEKYDDVNIVQPKQTGFDFFEHCWCFLLLIYR